MTDLNTDTAAHYEQLVTDRDNTIAALTLDKAGLETRLANLQANNDRQCTRIEEQELDNLARGRRIDDLLVQLSQCEADFNKISHRLNVEAEDRGWCSDYDSIVNDLNSEMYAPRLQLRGVDETFNVELRIEVKAGGQRGQVMAAIQSYLYNHLDNSSDWRRVAEDHSVVSQNFIVRGAEIQTED